MEKKFWEEETKDRDCNAAYSSWQKLDLKNDRNEVTLSLRDTVNVFETSSTEVTTTEIE